MADMGEEFVKKIRPAGCVMFIVLAILVAVVCLTAGRDPIRGYEPPQSDEYYARHLDELQAELEANVFPQLEGVLGSRVEDNVLVVELDTNYFAVTRSALLRYYGQELFRLERVETGG